MISGRDIYGVLAAVVPLYVAMVAAYASVRWWKAFTPSQCSGINRFVALFAVPLLSFHFISTCDLYVMDLRFIAADSLQKVVVLVALFLWHTFFPGCSSIDWFITLFSLATLPNSLVMGIPLLRSMYGNFSVDLMVQIVVLQSVVWYNILLVLFEYRGARALLADQFLGGDAGQIAVVGIEPDVVLSLNGREDLQADAESGRDDKLHVLVPRSVSISDSLASSAMISPRTSNLSGVDIDSYQMTAEPKRRHSSFNQSDLPSVFAAGKSPGYCDKHNRGSGLSDHVVAKLELTDRKRHTENGNKKKRSRRLSASAVGPAPYPEPIPTPSAGSAAEGNRKRETGDDADGGAGVFGSNKELHVDVQTSHGSVSENSIDRNLRAPSTAGGLEGGHDQQDPAAKYTDQETPPPTVMARQILVAVCRKLIRNPNTYSTLLGLAWSLASYRWHVEMPSIVKGSISLLSDAGLGMAMFSLGLYMALQPKMIACSYWAAAAAMVVRFIAGPAVIAAAAVAVGLRGVLLHLTVVQAALPQAIVPFVFAKEYNCHPDILSTAVIFGMLIALPVTIVYYVIFSEPH